VTLFFFLIDVPISPTAALSEAMAELGLKTGTIVTRNEDERMNVEAGTIEVVPAWRFLLGLLESAE
jgi:predicted AAA+ superfamily ATPase